MCNVGKYICWKYFRNIFSEDFLKKSYMCDGFRVPAASHWSLRDSPQAHQGLVTDVTPFHNLFNVMQMVAPRAAIWLHIAMGGRSLRGHHACMPH